MAVGISLMYSLQKLLSCLNNLKFNAQIIVLQQDNVL
jgi:hypothetical protein